MTFAGAGARNAAPSTAGTMRISFGWLRRLKRLPRAPVPPRLVLDDVQQDVEDHARGRRDQDDVPADDTADGAAMNR